MYHDIKLYIIKMLKTNLDKLKYIFGGINYVY